MTLSRFQSQQTECKYGGNKHYPTGKYPNTTPPANTFSLEGHLMGGGALHRPSSHTGVRHTTAFTEELVASYLVYADVQFRYG